MIEEVYICSLTVWHKQIVINRNAHALHAYQFLVLSVLEATEPQMTSGE